jgi:hypothetical protein
VEVIAMKLIGKAILLGLAVGTATVIGCGTSQTTGPSGGSSGQHGGPGVTGSDTNGTGTIGLQLHNPDGSQIASVHFVLSHIGADGGVVTDRTGDISTNNSESIEFQIGGVPAGTGYTITLTANTTDGGITCIGSASGIVIVAHATTSASVQLLCTAPGNDAGNLYVVGVPFYCATWNSLSTVLPNNSNGNEVQLGGVINLDATATGPDPNNLTYTWSQSSDAGLIGGFCTASADGGCASLATQTDTAVGQGDHILFMCNSVGTTTITLLITDGPVPDAGTCPANLQTVTTTVTCETNAGFEAGLICSAGQTKCGTPPACVDTTSDPNNCGTCGTKCSVDAGQACVSSVCKTPPPPLTTDSVLTAVSAACDTCAHTNGCVDDTTAGTTNENCDDQTGNATAGPAAGTANKTLCFADLQCVLPPTNSCARVTSGSTVGAAIGPCYCGPAEPGTGCLSATDQNGVCLTQIQNGLETTNPGTISTGLATPTTPGGVANAIVKCLISNKCGSCFP